MVCTDINFVLPWACAELYYFSNTLDNKISSYDLESNYTVIDQGPTPNRKFYNISVYSISFYSIYFYSISFYRLIMTHEPYVIGTITDVVRR